MATAWRNCIPCPAARRGRRDIMRLNHTLAELNDNDF
jgi:hypothetical protein